MRALVLRSLVLLLLGAPAAGQDVWHLVRTESPAIEWDYADGRFTRDGTSAHYIREPNGEHFDLRFTWHVPQQLTAGVAAAVELTADVVAGWPCRPFFLGARVFLSQNPCAFCVDGVEVGAGICDEHDAGMRAFRIEPGNFGQPEARLHVQVTDGSLFSATVVTYVYARGAAATATATPPPTPTRTRTPTGNPTPTRTPTRTPTAPADDEIACGESVHGVLSDTDADLFDDGTFADPYFFTLTRTTTVRFSMTGDGFAPFLWIGDLSNPDDWEPIFQGGSPQEGRLVADRYVVIANNTSPIPPGSYPYTLRMDCDGGATPTATASPTRTRTATRTPSPPAATPSPTRSATPTPSAASTPSRSASPTATLGGCVIPADAELGTAAGGCTDLIADAIEVVQSIQDLDNSIPLVAGKPTFVRFHVHSTQGAVRATARLRVGTSLGDPLAEDLKPINPGGYITVVEQPDRTLPDGAFLFEIPAGFLGYEDGDLIVLEAEVDPDRELAESTRSNNTLHATEAFRFVPPMRVILYHVGYDGIAAPSGPAERRHAARARDWLAAAYPVPGVALLERSVQFPSPLAVSCAHITTGLRIARVVNRVFDADTRPATLYYAMIFDRDERDNFVRGETLAPKNASSRRLDVSCGPTGDPRKTGRYRWDTDGSYGDWYAGHELGHALGQQHPGVCDDEIDPYNGPGPHHQDGAISAAQEGHSAVFGFDIWSREIYMPGPPGFWTDMMTYCDRVWISDLTYLAILDRLRPTTTQAAAPLVVEPIESVLVAGTIDPDTGTVAIEPLLTLPASEFPAPAPGEFTIVLRDAAGAELARHPFTPDRPSDDPHTLSFAELVPAVDDVARVDVEGPGVFGTRQAGPARPQVTLRAPDGGEDLAGDTVSVTWTASDADGDALTFAVQYSADDGASWELLARDVSGTAVDIPAFNLAPSEAGRFRVWASDGIHSADDISDGPFRVANRAPEIEVVAPADGVIVARGQTVALLAEVSDLGSGPPPDDQIEWQSDRDGVLGTGRRLAIADLSVGRHLVTVRADDGAGGAASAQVRIVVVAELSQLPACTGDCSGDGTITVDELVTGVGIALGSLPLTTCAPFDADGGGVITVAELIAAVSAALGGC